MIHRTDDGTIYFGKSKQKYIYIYIFDGKKPWVSCRLTLYLMVKNHGFPVKMFP